ncbi:LexA/Signal peptidase [Tilletiaria anomala UBC 951]|uniref:Mitochondrial inner membrane protease subunit 2 n=1 Tax=Tilletiaria anomala (strain ATCC 24038 / CBS 436.72 / UBC 951) TaxID=1037660 RepID=A0A066W3H7_TILAU|nr:LexA/Signal peptidase [Tilletiaria anomala UBC 951]KDN45315.1 LexA/Signal peptidase [Tilletiaria anomala UBC 951]
MPETLLKPRAWQPSSISDATRPEGRRHLNEDSHVATSAFPQKQERRQGRWGKALNLAAWVPVAAFVVSHIVSIGQVKGGSMIPTFNPEAAKPGTKHGPDIVLLNRWVIGKHHYRVGDVVHLTSPTDPSLLLTKRILALEGDVVILHSPQYSLAPALLPSNVDIRTRIRVPPGHAWVEGDASAEEGAHLGEGKGKGRSIGHSDDSREFGLVPLGLVKSRVELILWPPSRFGRPAPRPGFHASHGEFVSFDASARESTSRPLHIDRNAPCTARSLASNTSH